MTQKIDLKKLIPSELQNELNTALTTNLFNRFLSEEQSVFVAGQVGKITDPSDSVISNDVDRELNALIPALYFKTGSEESTYTFDDLINKMEALGVDVENLRSSLAEQSLNFVPPIDLDKFINYSNYYWVNSLPARQEGVMTWNPSVDPEYYLIARPKSTDTTKLPVDLATTRDVKLFGKDRANEQITVQFQDQDNFTLTGSNGPLIVSSTMLVGAKTTFSVYAPDLSVSAHGVGDPDTNPDLLFSFEITRGSVEFEANDKFEIAITYVTGSNTIAFIPGPSQISANKGFLSNIIADQSLMFVDGVRVQVGDTVLVKNQTNAAENGVYTVKQGAWIRTTNYTNASNFPLSTQIYVLFGGQANKTFESTSTITTLGVDPLTFTAVSGNPPLQINEWQQYNFWVHKNDVEDINAGVQATRPIVEYSNLLQMNKFALDGFPFDSGTSYAQVKTRFNQIPQFDLFYYDGHHAKKTSGIFFYEEDPDYEIDAKLLRRVKITINSDYVFGLGIQDEAGRLLYFKEANQLKTIWTPGVIEPTPTDVQNTGAGDGVIQFVSINPITDVQDWVLTATSQTTFEVVGSRSGLIGIATVGTLFENEANFNLLIHPGSTPFADGDTLTFSINNKVAPRYVEVVDGKVVNIQDSPDMDPSGTWLVPRRMFENLKRELSVEIAYGDMIDHFRSIIKSQDGFEGSSFGVNNYRNIPHDLGLGGNIREYSSNFPLLASMLIQPGMSPLSVLDFAEQQYATALASVDQFLLDELSSYISKVAVPVTTSIDANNQYVQDIMSKFEAARAVNQTLKDVFGDSTAKVKNWPATLPMLGLAPASVPHIQLDAELNMQVVIHHDGHASPIYQDDAELNRTLTRTFVTRSDGVESAGVFSTTSPAQPYARQLWFNPTNNQLSAFNVVSDLDQAPATGAAGDFWYRRSINELREWDTISNSWILSSSSVASRWVLVDVATIRNSLLLAVERKLYDSVHPAILLKYDLTQFGTDALAQIELAKFSAKYNYDTYAPMFDQTDAFTWNYKVSLGKARWFDAYYQNFDVVGSLPTARPDLEPWKLLGHATKPAGWDAAYAGTTRPWSTQMWVDIKNVHPTMKLCVNTSTDQLLPPYVSNTLPESVEALLTTMPTNIADTFEFLDNGPVELVWRKSLEYNYALARVFFKKQPLLFLDKTWGETYVYTAQNTIRLERNISSSLSPSEFQLHGEPLHLITNRDAEENFVGSLLSTGPASVKFVVTHVEDNKAFFFAYVNDLLIGMVNEGQSFSINNSGVTINGMIDDLGIPFNMGDQIQITFDGSPDVKFEFIPGKVKKFVGLGQLYTNLLRFNYFDLDKSKAANAYRGWDVRLAHRIGALIRGDSLEIKSSLGILPDTAYELLLKRSENLNSRWISALRIQLVQAGTRVNDNGNYIPFEDGSDWVFRLETYNPLQPTIEYYSFDESAEYQTFNALQGQHTSLPWKRYIKRAQLNVATTPFVVVGVQQLITIMFGYIDRLNELGFQVNESEEVVIDEETGRNLDWQLEVEKFIDRVYSNLGPGEGHILNPFMHALWLNTPEGLMSHFADNLFVDVNASQAVFDVNGHAIPLRDLFVIRTDEHAVTYSDTPIFSAHVFNDEYEHVILFNQRLSDEVGSSTIFDPFLGMRIDTARLSYTRQAEVDRKPRFNGFVLQNNDVVRNITSSVDNIANYYDASKTFNEQTTAKHALALLGFTSKDYFTDIGVSDATQFNFWRGLIQAKGTNQSIDAFVNYKKFTDASVDEYWAYKVADYGDSRPRNLPEIKIEQADCQQHFTQLQFYDKNEPVDALPLFTLIEKDDDARWFSIDDLGKGMSFDVDKTTIQVAASAAGYYPLSVIFHNSDGVTPTVMKNGVVTTDATIINASLLKVTVPGTFTVTGYTWTNPTKQSPVKLFDYKTNTLVKQISVWHPAIGIHAQEPLEIVNVISSSDPALYNYSTQTTSNPNFTQFKPWGRKEVGRVWWNTENLGYVPYYDATVYSNRSERNARWGGLAEWATVDLLEWVESSVPPSEYDALALVEEGRSDIDVSLRASGKAANKSYYKRERTITIRPIAWSEAGVGDQSSHPSFGPAYSTAVIYAGSALYADAGRVEQIGLVEDKHFSGWLSGKPVGEVVIGAEQVYDLGSSVALAAPISTDIEVKQIVNGRFGQFIGQINLSSRTGTDDRIYLIMSDDFGFSEEIDVTDWNGTGTDVREINFADFGLKIICMGDMLVTEIVDGWEDVYVREGVRVTELIPLPDTYFINDDADVTHDYGWKSWNVPTQAQLDADLSIPRNTWQPYLGDEIEVAATAAIAAEMATPNLLLKSGITIMRYNSTWSDWELLKTVKVGMISDGVTTISFTRTSGEPFDFNRLSIYVNGIQLNPQSYTISGEIGEEVIEIVNILPEGTKVLMVFRGYQPTAEELEFDPDVEDDATVQAQYKADYQYTKVDVRNEAGVITSAKYYFWVQDKTTVNVGRNMSLSQAKSVLQNGPSQFVMYARVKDDSFDSCVLAGLNNLVANNDTYKLRFLRDHTLRDDPEQLNLKNTHTEWALIRRSQTSRIPKSLWDHLTNAADGKDLGGNPLPTQTRVDYDLRNGTRTRFGFQPGQIFAATELVRTTITNTILNTALTIKLGSTTIPDYITALNMDESEEWMTDENARSTMDLIWASARPRQINEIFFEVLEDALANNYEFSDLFKTSLISVFSTTKVDEQVEGEIQDGEF